MSNLRPPRLATWLLRKSGSGAKYESLMGDLMEEYQRRRSPAWYWRQVVGSILAGMTRDIRSHRWLALRAAIGGLVLLSLCAIVVRDLYLSAGLVVWNWTVEHGWDGARVWWFGRPRFPQPPLLTAPLVYAAVVGWVLARLHRQHAIAMVVSCAGLYFALNVCGLAWRLWLHPPAEFLPGLAIVPTALLVFLVVPGSMVLGGLLGCRSDDSLSKNMVTSD